MTENHAKLEKKNNMNKKQLTSIRQQLKHPYTLFFTTDSFSSLTTVIFLLYLGFEIYLVFFSISFFLYFFSLNLIYRHCCCSNFKFKFQIIFVLKWHSFSFCVYLCFCVKRISLALWACENN